LKRGQTKAAEDRSSRRCENWRLRHPLAPKKLQK
jgi:hypothetical protein